MSLYFVIIKRKIDFTLYRADENFLLQSMLIHYWPRALTDFVLVLGQRLTPFID